MNEDRLVWLIDRQLFGKLDQEQAQELASWSTETPASRRLLESFTEELLQKEIGVYRRLDPEAAYSKWLSGQQTHRRTLVVRFIGWSAAASILIGVSVIGLTRKTLSDPASKPAVAHSAPIALPGRNAAVLTLANGQKVLLDSTANGDLGVQGNARLTKLGNGSLAYKSSKSNQAEQIFNTLTTPRSGQYQLLLPDGSRVWLNNASSIRYPVAFQGKDRTVELSGEAYFEIAKNVSQPFRVKVNGLSVEVLGTSFNIMAYSDEDAISTTLLSGSVRVRQGATSVQLLPEEQAKVSPNGELKVLKNVPAEDIVSWKNGFFYFGRASLKEVMRQLARWYDVNVEYAAGAVSTQEFEGKIDRDLPLQELLRYLEKNQVHFRLEEKDKKIVVLP